MFLWGIARGHRIALCSAALAAAKGLQVAVFDADTAFQATPLVATTKACQVAPGALLGRAAIARAFTCRPVATLVSERLAPLLAREPIALIVLLGPLTTFFDEDVTYREAKILLQRVLQTLTHPQPHRPRVLVALTVAAYHTPRSVFARDLLRVVDVGLRLLPGSGRWAVEVGKPKPSGHQRSGLLIARARRISHKTLKHRSPVWCASLRTRFPAGSRLMAPATASPERMRGC